MSNESNGRNVVFNKQALRKAKLRLWIRRSPKILLALLVVGVSVYSFSIYLSNVPRERFARGYKFLERVWLGAETVARMTSLKLSAYHEDMKNTQLPVAEIYIRGKRIDKLKEALPNTNVSPEKAKIRIADKGYKGRVRFRGDSINHWAYPNKSWRVQLKDGEFYRGMQYFNLNVPRSESQMANWLGYQLARDMGGVIAPHAENVHFRLNRKFDGVRLLLERPNQDMLIRRYFPPGKIFVGDIETEQIYGGAPRNRLYSEPSAWTVRGPGNDQSLEELEAFLRTVSNDSDPYVFYDQMNSIVNMEALTKYMALLELVGSVHVDETHNGKFYFQSHLGQFEPIAWDTVAYFWENSFGLDLGVNRLFRVVIQNPAFRSMKDKYLWEAVNGNLGAKRILEKVDREADRLRRDLYAFPFKLNANDKGVRHMSNRELEEGIARLRQAIVDRDARVRNHFTDTNVQYQLFPRDASTNSRLLAVEVASPSGFELKSIEVNLGESRPTGPIRLVREGLEDMGTDPVSGVLEAEKLEGNRYLFKTNDHLLSKRKFEKHKSATVVPGTYRYRLTGVPDGAVELSLKGTNAITGKAAKAKAVTTINPEAGTKKYAVWWSPEDFKTGKQVKLSGKVTLSEDLVLSPYDSLTVAPGTVLSMGPGVSIYANGSKVEFNGTAAQPIVVTQAKPGEVWGTIALRQVKEGALHYVTLRGGSFERIDHVRYEGLLAVHGGEVTADHLTVEGNYISASSGRLTLQSSDIRSPFPFSVKAENAIVREIETTHEETPRSHSLRLLDSEGVGTPARAEREFKFSIVTEAQEERDLLDVAKEMRNALERRLSDRSVWNASKLVNADYYVDDGAEDFLFRDIYFDTKDKLAYKNQISYRYRNRYKSWGAYKEHIKQPDWPTLWPYRLEFQAKVNRKELGGGFSTVEESRFEFRDASVPFSPENPPPDAPWDEREFLTYFENGTFAGKPTYPAQAVLETLKGQFSGESVAFYPKLVLVTERYRQHLNIPSEYGSGPNPEQSFIISLDKSRVYEAKRYLKFLNDKKEGLKYARKPDSLGSLLEVEVEFERNVSDVLDRKIKEATSDEERSKLSAVRDAFLADQSVIMQVVDEELKGRGLDVVAADKSKYVQAYELAALSAAP